MTDWNRVQELFEAAGRLEQSEWEAYLDEACEGDQELKDEVLSLLQADASPGFTSSIAEAAQDFVEDLDRSRTAERVGPYELVRILGAGGMGTVYLGRRADEEYEADVAVKFLRAGPYLPDVARRFRSERQILANLNHPNIARLLDGGATPDGVPYLVMEFVEGERIDAYCDRLNLDIEGRLRLFLSVCRAVQHAHQNLVIHRDLKPANILVTDDGRVKLLDFGIAKILEDDSAGEYTVTTPLLTPSFASPEQLLGEPISIGTDVYSLGAVLFLLLTTKPPFEPAVTPAELAQRATTHRVPRPSAAAADSQPGGRNPRPRPWVKALEGDLDTILLKAMAKEPEHRYGTVESLGADIGRYLKGEPILARPQTNGYRLRKFIRRHPVGVATAALFSATVVGFSVVSGVQAQRIAEERDRATRGEAAAQEVSDFLVGLFEGADPTSANPDSISAREMLDQGVALADQELREQPGVRSDVLAVLGRVYQNLGLLDQAGVLLDTVLAINEHEDFPDPTRLFAAQSALAHHHYLLGEYEEAEALNRVVLERIEVEDPGSEVHVAVTANLAASVAELGRYDEAGPLYQALFDLYRSIGETESARLAADYGAYGDLLRNQGQLDSAAVVLEETLRLQRARFGDRHVEVAYGLNQLSRTYSLLGDNERALPLAEEGLVIRRSIYGEDHAEVGASYGNVAGILANLGRLSDSERYRRSSLASLIGAVGENHPYIAATRSSLGAIMIRQEDFAGAEAMYRQSLADLRGFLDDNHVDLAYPLVGLGQALTGLDRGDEAEPFLREALRVRSEALPEGNFQVGLTEYALAQSLMNQQKVEEAIQLFESAEAILRESFGPDDTRTQTAAAALEEARSQTP